MYEQIASYNCKPTWLNFNKACHSVYKEMDFVFVKGILVKIQKQSLQGCWWILIIPPLLRTAGGLFFPRTSLRVPAPECQTFSFKFSKSLIEIKSPSLLWLCSFSTFLSSLLPHVTSFKIHALPVWSLWWRQGWNIFMFNILHLTRGLISSSFGRGIRKWKWNLSLCN